MERPAWAPAELDLDRPNAARMYDYYLGGSHNFAVDRELAGQVLEAWPDMPRAAQANRAFLRRAVRFLAAQGIRQFLDIGSGIPTVGNVHEVARPRPRTRGSSTSTPTPWRSHTPGRSSSVTRRPGSCRPTAATRCCCSPTPT